jgi:hypothetical protein
MLDLNHLYHRLQIELMRADRASCLKSRRAHEGLAMLYKGRIDYGKRERRVAQVAAASGIS